MAPVTLALAGQVRTITAKHWAPKWRKLRAQKTKKVSPSHLSVRNSLLKWGY